MSEDKKEEEVENLQDWYCSIPERFIRKYAKQIPFDLFLKLSETKVVKIVHKQGEVADIVDKYLKKGVEGIYARKEDYVIFLNTIRLEMSKEKKGPNEARPSDRIEELHDAHKMVKESFKKIGITTQALDLAKEIAANAVDVISCQPSALKFYHDFLRKCGREFVNNVMVAYLGSEMIKKFDWGSEKLQEKFVAAVMLRDILLEPEDFNELRSKEKAGSPDALNDRIKNHPSAVADLLRNGQQRWFQQEVALIIEEHHERPGFAFPNNVNGQKVHMLSAVAIVAEDFVYSVVDKNFNPKDKNGIMDELKEKYNIGNFKRVFQTLSSMMN